MVIVEQLDNVKLIGEVLVHTLGQYPDSDRTTRKVLPWM